MLSVTDNYFDHELEEMVKIYQVANNIFLSCARCHRCVGNVVLNMLMHTIIEKKTARIKARSIKMWVLAHS